MKIIKHKEGIGIKYIWGYHIKDNRYMSSIPQMEFIGGIESWCRGKYQPFCETEIDGYLIGVIKPKIHNLITLSRIMSQTQLLKNKINRYENN